jgi:hypothetical protein
LNPSQHDRSRRARLVLAIGGIAAVLAACGAADLAARRYGTLAGAALIAAVFAACWIVFRVRPLLHAARPAPVRLPEPAGDLEPASSLS